MKNIRQKLKTQLTTENKHATGDEELGNVSDSSDISTFTDMKVFKGAFKNLSKINQVHTTSQQKEGGKPFEDQIIKKKTADKFEENGRTLPINCEFNPKDNFPISFRSHTEITGQNFSHKINKEINSSTQKRIEEIMNRLSKNESLDRDDSKGTTIADCKANDKKTDERFLRIIRDSFEEAGEESEIFGRSNSLNRLDRRGNSLKNNANLFSVSKNVKPFSDVQCTLSKIEKGTAIFVSSEHCIFTLPANFLPKNVQCGNTYEVSIKQTLNECKKYSDIQKIQEKFTR